MATYKVFQKKVNKKGEAPVYISFYIERTKVEVPTRMSIVPCFFDKEKGCIKASYEFSKDRNLIINDIKSTINDIFVKYRLKKESLSVDLFWQEYNKKGNYSNFFDFCAEYQNLRFQEVTISTQKKHRACLNNLRSFKENIFFSELTTEFFRRFVLYLRNRRGNSEVTINKTIHIISIYLNDALKKDLIKENPIHGLKLRGAEDSTAESLTEEEFITLKDMYNNHVFMDNTHLVLEFFLFMCMSSLHISDAKALRIDQIGDDELYYTRMKMLNIRPKIVRIPICDTLKQIINHQKRDRTSGILWDNVISDQKINKKLKDIAQIAGVNENLSAKFGRHTFATIFLRKTKDINTLKNLMGHSNLKQTLVYAHVIDADRKEGIKIFDTLL